MRRVSLSALEAVAYAVGLFGTYWLLSELRDPYSALRLHAEELLERVKGATR